MGLSKKRKIIKVDITVSSDDLYNSYEECANYIQSSINAIITKANNKFNTSAFKVRRVDIISNIQTTIE